MSHTPRGNSSAQRVPSRIRLPIPDVRTSRTPRVARTDRADVVFAFAFFCLVSHLACSLGSWSSPSWKARARQPRTWSLKPDAHGLGTRYVRAACVVFSHTWQPGFEHDSRCLRHRTLFAAGSASSARGAYREGPAACMSWFWGDVLAEAQHSDLDMFSALRLRGTGRSRWLGVHGAD